MKVKDIVGISSVEVTIAISEDEGATFHSFNEDDKRVMNANINSLEERNGIIILHINNENKIIYSIFSHDKLKKVADYIIDFRK